MRIGCWTPLRSASDGISNPLDHAIEGVKRAEDDGFDMCLVAERWQGPWLESWLLSTAIAVNTRSIELITAVHPGVLAPQVVAKFGQSLHEISNGRCAINVVNGVRPEELDLYGNGGWLSEPEERYRRMDEFVQVIKGLWTNGSFCFDGEFYKARVSGVPLINPKSSAPRIYSTSNSVSGQSAIARSCDAWFFNAKRHHRRYKENFAAITAEIGTMNERCRANARRLEYCLNATVLCAETEEAGLEQADKFEHQAGDDPAMLFAGGVRGLGGGLVGPPGLVAERMQRYVELGISGFMLRFLPDGVGSTQFVRAVVPRLDRTSGSSGAVYSGAHA
jgi:FMNH2-dependent dimethyl sulfone monooxygenase